MKTFVIGDIHGAYKALLQCLDRSGFDRKGDRLIVIGDVCDGYPEVRQCIDELLMLEHCDLVIGNHDLWSLDWALRGDKPEIWTSQGGDRTIASYNGGPMPQAHIDFLKNGRPWLELDGRIFVHGGFDPAVPLLSHDVQTLVWDRNLLNMAWQKSLIGDNCQVSGYKDIFIGHTTTQVYNTSEPVHLCNVWDGDTGAGWSGKLTIMDVETKKYWQSDFTPELYGGVPGRTRKE